MTDNRIRGEKIRTRPLPALSPHSPEVDLRSPYRIVDASQVPVYINNRDRVSTVKVTVDWLLSAGTQRIVILDNDSTYPPLLEYYKTLPFGVSVHYYGANLGPGAFWDIKKFHLRQDMPYVFTDSDMVPDEGCPKDLIHRLNMLLNEHPESGKVGPGLKIADIPDLYSMNGCDRNEQVQYWKSRYSPEAFFAAIDTTFALYPAYSNGRVDTLLPDGTYIQFSHDNLSNLRMDNPYVWKHAPWYAVPPLSEEELYYRTHCNKEWSHSIGL